MQMLCSICHGRQMSRLCGKCAGIRDRSAVLFVCPSCDATWRDLSLVVDPSVPAVSQCEGCNVGLAASQRQRTLSEARRFAAALADGSAEPGQAMRCMAILADSSWVSSLEAASLLPWAVAAVACMAKVMPPNPSFSEAVRALLASVFAPDDPTDPVFWSRVVWDSRGFLRRM